ncbi:MAG TPA: hypothetical protein VHM90_18675 [Phycisphaerae bacterium]|nr:hypothetical protein [Phycisphaerae bacterium]
MQFESADKPLREALPMVPRISGRTLLLVSALTFAFLALWARLFPYTGDGDSILHFLNAQLAAHKPAEALYAWARPGYKLPLALFAALGIYPARLFNAAITVACLWQTIRLAEDLRLRTALLAAPMFLFQTCAFALAADTMTEIPLALGIAVATRLWLARRLELSALVVGFLPLLRPEGFFLGILWGLMVLFARGSIARKARTLALMALGLLLWSAACRGLTGDWFRVLHAWSWPANTYAAYPRGPFWYYPARWPEYCGLPLLVLFVTGILALCRDKSLRARLALPITVWLLIFLLHATLFTGGWFCSSGVLRILACSAPMTALVCLLGWNSLARRFPALATRRAALAATAFIAAWGIAQYFLYAEHLYFVPTLRTAAWIRDHDLLSPATPFAAGNQMLVAELGMRPDSSQLLNIPFNEKTWPALQTAPAGTILVWDNRQSEAWFRISIEELRAAGYVQLHEEEFTWCTLPLLGGGTMRCVVLRKAAG